MFPASLPIWPSLVLVLTLGGGCFDLKGARSGSTDGGGSPGQPDLLVGHCANNRRDADETDRDCGGSCGATCVYGQRCLTGRDCAVGQCLSGVCTPPGSTCSDHVKDGTETDVDCGGGCPLCADGKGCNSGSDCQSGSCASGRCAAGQPPFSFGPARYALVGQGTVAIASGDFDGDGHLDLASADSDDNRVSVLLGLGNGRFRDPQRAAVGRGPEDLVAADLDGDGHLDLATADRTGSTVSILLGAGDGSFRAASPASIAVDTATAINAGDLSGSGHTDLLVSGERGTLALLAGRGGGQFQVPAVQKVGQSAYGTVIADFNGDRRADVAAIADYAVIRLLNLGSGKLGQQLTVPAGGGDWSLTAGDVDLDGKVDLVSTTYSGYACALRGDGRGGFGKAVCTNLGGAPRAPRLADLDGDGKPDLALLVLGTGNVGLLRGHGDGTFDPAMVIYVGGSPQTLLLGDFNGDGKPDLALCDFFSHDVGVLLNTHP